ncbi:transcriptional regulator [Roseivivax halodurans JCM 10272]|uniref:Transcriptional regulator n=1 Tax=Roseivivax halodurans JCM 10272 TaxID=1449350 RepID=X7EG66_9RHOB|nr:helix-turn-helix domain-containing protein [Roseivivax halodurans]ETX14108.1 transcriptional regulator [Roseivivax halodurans JCM 10272]
MPGESLTGSRIRERRIMAGLKQADLAREANISPSYLNLIEHNRRRIGGKLLLDIAQILEVEPAILTEGAEATLIAGLREAAAHARGGRAEIDRIDEFAGRFPGWADLLAESHRRVGALEHSVETLSDRLTHDPHLAAALHEMLSTVTAIRSTASILAEPGELPPAWQRRFHRNIHEDAARLAETSRTLVGYLDAAEDASAEATVPQEEVDAILEQAGHRFPLIETGALNPEEMAARLAGEASATARQMLVDILARYAADAAALPLARLRPALAAAGPDPFVLAEALGADPARVMRRLAALPEDALEAPAGLVVSDGAGALTYRKPLPDFPLPRFGAGCPLWPLYQSLSHPMVPVARAIAQPGRTRRSFTAYAIATAVAPLRPGQVPLYSAHMLIVPVPPDAEGAADPMPVGVTCRICPHDPCQARREPSILARDGLGGR